MGISLANIFSIDSMNKKYFLSLKNKEEGEMSVKVKIRKGLLNLKKHNGLIIP